MFYYHVKLALSYDYALLPDYGRIPNRKWRRNCFFTLYRFLPISELSAWNKIKNDFPIMNVNPLYFNVFFAWPLERAFPHMHMRLYMRAHL